VVEPQVNGPENLKAEVDEPQAEHEEQEDAEETQGGFMFGGIPWNAWWIDNWGQFDGDLNDSILLRT